MCRLLHVQAVACAGCCYVQAVVMCRLLLCAGCCYVQAVVMCRLLLCAGCCYVQAVACAGCCYVQAVVMCRLLHVQAVVMCRLLLCAGCCMCRLLLCAGCCYVQTVVMYNFQSFQSCFGTIEQHWRTMKIKTINKNLFILTKHFVNFLTKTFTLAYTLLICRFISISEFLTKIVLPRYNRGKHVVRID